MELKLSGSPGQVWRRKRDGTRIILIRQRDGDWTWEAVTDRSKRGVLFDYSLTQLYDLENADGLTPFDLAWERYADEVTEIRAAGQDRGAFLAGWNARATSIQ